jgi:hypothetical protein
MTTNAAHLTDELLRRSLAELAAGPDADMLLTDVLRTVDGQAQVARRPWDTRGWGRAMVLVAAAALLAAATIGATVVLTQPKPSPQPTRTPLPLTNEVIRVPDFTVPFSYRMPAGMSGKLEVSYTPDSFYAIRAKTGDGGSFFVFPITGEMHAFPVTGSSRTCMSRPDPKNDQDLTAFLQGLDEGPVSPTSLGGEAALSVAIDPAHSASRNALFHIHGLAASQLEPSLSLANPGRLIVTATGAGAVGVLIYAADDTALADWMPVAAALVNGFRFDATALSERVETVNDFAITFTYRLPVGASAVLEGHGSGNRVYLLDSRAGGSGTLELFPVSGYAHGCGASSGNGLPTASIGSYPTAFLEALGSSVGVGMGPITETTLGGLPAVAADIEPTKGTCDRAMLHIDGMGLSYADYEPQMNRPGRLIVTRANGKTVGVFISAPSQELLTGWLPIAQAYLDGLRFDTP